LGGALCALEVNVEPYKGTITMIKQIDSKGNEYFDVENIRVTCVGKTWGGDSGIRIQAYKGTGKSLHQGAELPVPDAATAYKLIAAIVAAFELKNSI
jgi:hypothetical protein